MKVQFNRECTMIVMVVLLVSVVVVVIFVVIFVVFVVVVLVVGLLSIYCTPLSIVLLPSSSVSLLSLMSLAL